MALACPAKRRKAGRTAVTFGVGIGIGVGFSFVGPGLMDFKGRPRSLFVLRYGTSQRQLAGTAEPDGLARPVAVGLGVLCSFRQRHRYRNRFVGSRNRVMRFQKPIAIAFAFPT